MGVGRAHRDHRIDERGRIGPGGGVAEMGEQGSADMAAGGEAHGADAGRVDARRGADQADGAAGIVQRHVRARRPALLRQPVEEDEGGDAARREQAGHLVALLVDHHPIVAAAGDDQHRRAVRPLGPEDGEARPGDPLEDAVVIGRVGAALGPSRPAAARASGRPLRPQVDLGISLWRLPGGDGGNARPAASGANRRVRRSILMAAPHSGSRGSAPRPGQRHRARAAG
jgi:hypothetical protein